MSERADGGRVQQRRQQADQHEVGVELEAGDARDERRHDAHHHQHERRRPPPTPSDRPATKATVMTMARTSSAVSTTQMMPGPGSGGRGRPLRRALRRSQRPRDHRKRDEFARISAAQNRKTPRTRRFRPRSLLGCARRARLLPHTSSQGVASEQDRVRQQGRRQGRGMSGAEAGRAVSAVLDGDPGRPEVGRGRRLRRLREVLRLAARRPYRREPAGPVARRSRSRPAPCRASRRARSSRRPSPASARSSPAGRRPS